MSRLVVGLGNPLRGDDGAGVAVSDALGSRASVQSATGSFELIEAWADYDEVVIVDATLSGEPPGTINRFDATMQPLPNGTFASTHAIGIAETIELARLFGLLPPRLIVIGIEAGDMRRGADMSPEVALAVAQVVAELDRA